MDEMEIFLRLGFMGLGLVLTALTLASWYRARAAKLLLAAAGFGTLAFEGVLLTLGVFSGDIEALNSIAMLVGLNFLAMIFLYMSILKR